MYGESHPSDLGDRSSAHCHLQRDGGGDGDIERLDEANNRYAEPHVRSLHNLGAGARDGVGDKGGLRVGTDICIASSRGALLTSIKTGFR